MQVYMQNMIRKRHNDRIQVGSRLECVCLSVSTWLKVQKGGKRGNLSKQFFSFFKREKVLQQQFSHQSGESRKDSSSSFSKQIKQTTTKAGCCSAVSHSCCCSAKTGRAQLAMKSWQSQVVQQQHRQQEEERLCRYLDRQVGQKLQKNLSLIHI